MSDEELDCMVVETIDSELTDFAKYYFNKEYKDLSKEEHHEIDCFGMYGVSLWLIDYHAGKVKGVYDGN